MNFIEELKWRGMLHDIMPGTEEQLQKEMTTAYVGIDPTADSLHIGHLCGVMMLRHFQRCGHKPIALLGGATGMIGDPSGKSAERNLLDEETLRHNVACIKKQLEHSPLRLAGPMPAHGENPPQDASQGNWRRWSRPFRRGRISARHQAPTWDQCQPSHHRI